MDIVWQAEDSLREKKVESDLKDLLKTMVAFANSVAPGATAKIFIGEKNDGTVQGVRDADSIQKRVVKEADKIYPEIYYHTEAYERDGKQCVRVDINHNGLAPHFGGPAWVRKGSETKKATEELYQQMIAQRQSKIRVLLQWVSHVVTVSWRNHQRVEERANVLYTFSEEQAELLVANEHWVTFRVRIDSTAGEVGLPVSHITRVDVDCSEPIERLMLSWDDVRGQLKVEVRG